MVLNATFSNISAILVEESGVPGENHQLVASHWQLYHIMLYRVHLVWVGFDLTTLVVIGTDYTVTMRSRPRYRIVLSLYLQKNICLVTYVCCSSCKSYFGIGIYSCYYATVTVNCRTAIKVLFPCLNLCLSVMLNISYVHLHPYPFLLIQYLCFNYGYLLSDFLIHPTNFPKYYSKLF
jgi:hypothetical protein